MKVFNEIIELDDLIVQQREGETFRQEKVFSDDKIYIYQVNGKYFEVFNRKVKPKRGLVNGKLSNIDGVGRVAYPNNEDFGKWAWHCHDKSIVAGVLKGLYEPEEIDAILASFNDNPYANRDGVDKYKGTEKLSKCIKQGWMMYND